MYGKTLFCVKKSKITAFIVIYAKFVIKREKFVLRTMTNMADRFKEIVKKMTNLSVDDIISIIAFTHCFRITIDKNRRQETEYPGGTGRRQNERPGGSLLFPPSFWGAERLQNRTGMQHQRLGRRRPRGSIPVVLSSLRTPRRDRQG